MYVSAGFEVLARTWGLFDGALDAPRDMDTGKNPALSKLSSNETKVREAPVKTVRIGRVHHGHGGRETPRLHASVPIRATPPHVMDLVRNHQQEASKSQPSPPLRADDDGFRGCCSTSPELTMQFVEKPESPRPGTVAAGQASTEALGGKRRVRCEYRCRKKLQSVAAPVVGVMHATVDFNKATRWASLFCVMKHIAFVSKAEYMRSVIYIAIFLSLGSRIRCEAETF